MKKFINTLKCKNGITKSSKGSRLMPTGYGPCKSVGGGGC